MSGHSTYRQSLEKGSFGEIYTNDCNRFVFRMALPELDGRAAVYRPAVTAAVLCRRAVLRQSFDVWLLRHALAALASGTLGPDCDRQADGFTVSATTGSRSVRTAAAGTR